MRYFLRLCDWVRFVLVTIREIPDAVYHSWRVR